jgi:Holliday junction resolvase RusA-like endonuclease
MSCYSITIVVPVLATDANNRRGKHWTQISSTNTKIKSIVRNLTTGKTPKKPLKKFNLSIVRHGPRSLDYDNLISSFKPYIDSLKHVGIIEDDSWKYIRWIEADQMTSDDKKLVITVKEVA